MTTHDKNGKPYAKLSELREGDRVEADSGFTCIPAGKVLIVEKGENGALCIPCNYGRHLLHTQADDGEHLIGIYRA